MGYSDRSYFERKLNQEDIVRLIGNSWDLIDEAIVSADSLINSYLKNIVSSLPLSYIPPSIQQSSYNIALFYLHDRIQYSEIPQWVKDKYNTAIDFLSKISKGIISLDIDTENAGADNYVIPDDNVKFFGNDLVMRREAF